MAESQILGLFTPPQMVETAVRQEIRQQAPEFEYAPNQRLFNNIAQAGAAFDPRVQRVSLEHHSITVIWLSSFVSRVCSSLQ